MPDFVLTGINHVQTIQLLPGLNQIGRNPTNNFRVHDATVSSFHCEITVANDSVTVKDLCSTNGTYIDDRQIEEALVGAGQILRMGSVEFRLEAGEVRIAIPTMPGNRPLAVSLPEGVMPCLIHRSVAASYQCTTCNDYFCGECVREIGRKGGEVKRFCPTCRGQCVLLQQAEAPKKKTSFFGRLTQTIRIRRN